MKSLRFSPETSSIVTTAYITGQRGANYARLVFDTGASLVMLPWGFAQAIGLPIDPNKTLKTTTASAIETSPLTTIPSLSVLGFTVHGVECLIHDLPAESGVDGLLGLSFLRHFNIEVNFEKGILELSPISTAKS